MIGEETIRINLRVAPAQQDWRILETVRERALACLHERHIKDLGIVTKVLRVEQLGGGEIAADTGEAHFWALVRVVVYRPLKDEVFVERVSEVSNEGYWLKRGSIVVFALRHKSVLSEGDEARICLKRIKYTRGQFLITGELV